MQERDAVSISYLEDEERFADLINGFACQGRQVVKPENIRDMNRVLLKIRRKAGRIKSRMLIRDLVKKVQVGMRVVIFAMENQSDIHYAMPVRVMDGESAAYLEQWKKIAKWHRNRKDLRGAEFLSGFGKHDKLLPVITIVVYFGNEPWDGPKTLKEMLDLSDLPEDLADLVCDYPIHLLEVRKYPYLDRFCTDLKYVFGFLQNEQDGEKLKAFMEKNGREMENMDEDAYDLMSVMAHSEELALMKTEIINERGGYDMCKGLREWMESERRQGEQDGMKRGEHSGILMAKRVIQMSMAGTDRKEIAIKCGISMEYVNLILDDSVA